ncbi:MAG: hypothetical protein Q8P46_11605 [Hyphomicrobiales bacterium]|nr:hypothetical protein [Hyphomicrobiales bacterium]
MPPVADERPEGETRGRPMRVGLLLEGGRVAGWQRAFVDRLKDDPGVSLALVIAAPQGPTGRPAHAIWSSIDAAERALARRLFGRSRVRGDISMEMLDNKPVGAQSLAALAGLPTVTWAEGADRAADEKAAAAIRAASLDVILDLGCALSSAEPGDMARHGVWTLCTEHGGYDEVTPFGFWEFYRNEPICTVRLVASSNDAPDALTVASGSYCIFRWSWNLNAMLLSHKVAWLLADTLKQVSKTRPSAGRGPRVPEAGRGRPQKTVPGVLQALTAPILNGGRVVLEAMRRMVFEDRWRVLLVEATPQGPASTSPMVIDPPPHSYWADPFLVRRDGKCYIFFEEYLYAKRRGVISYIEVSNPAAAPRAVAPPVHRVLDEPHHLSYPFLFSLDGSLYMVPETSRNRTIELWKCVEFPGVWRKEKNIMENLSAVDTSLLNWNGKWWLFTNMDRSGFADHRNELHVFHSEHPIDGPWLPHARNPVIVDARRARMAGGFLTAPDGRPVRCCQVQGKKYGESVAFSMIEELSETAYAETPIDDFAHVSSEPSARHHHIAYADGLIVADECRDTFKLGRILKLS